MTRGTTAWLPVAGELRAFLGAALLLGTAQQIFVTARNPYLLEAGWSLQQITPVQALSATAGVLAGLFAGWLARGWRPAWLLALCGLSQALGFAAQVLGVQQLGWVLAGAALAGFGVQLQLAMGPAFLRGRLADDQRTRAFSAWHLVLYPLAGLACLAAVALAEQLSDSEPSTQRLALLLAAGLSLLALLPALGLRHAPALPARPPGSRRSPGLAAVIALFALVGFAGGLSVPYLQLYLKLRFGLLPTGIAGLYALGLVAAALAYLGVPALTRRLGLERAAALVLIAAAPFFLLLAWTPLLPLAALGFVGRAASMRAGTPLLQQLTQERVAGADGATAAGGAVLAQSAAWAIGAWGAGPLLLAAGNRFDLLLPLSAALFGLAGLAVLGGRARRAAG